jgi:hypothetical protein
MLEMWLLTVIAKVEGELVEKEDEAKASSPLLTRDVCAAYLLGDQRWSSNRQRENEDLNRIVGVKIGEGTRREVTESSSSGPQHGVLWGNQTDCFLLPRCERRSMRPKGTLDIFVLFMCHK